MTKLTLERPIPATPAPPPPPTGDTLLGRIGGWCFDHGGKAAALWLSALVVVIAAAGALGSAFEAGSDVPGSDSAAGLRVLQDHFPHLGTGGQSGTVVFRAEQGVHDPEVVVAMERLFATVDAGFPDADGVPRAPGATVVSPYSAQGAAQVATTGPLAGKLAFAPVNLAAGVDSTEAGRIGDLLTEAAPDVDGLQVLAGGQYLATVEPPESELIGVAFAIVVLIMSFGSVLAMGLPVAVALGGVAVGVASIALLSNVLTMPSDTTVLGLMIGLGVGIDYALFVVTRYREAVRAGHAARAATVIAMTTAGRAVVFAGATVVISMLGLVLVGLGWLSGMGIGVSATVLATMVTSATLLPALLGLTHRRLEVTRWRGLLAAGAVAVALLGAGLGWPALAAAGALGALLILVASAFIRLLRRQVPHRRARPLESTLSHRWSRAVQRRPGTALVAATGVLLVLAAPVLGMRLAWPDERSFPADTSTRRAYELLADGFGAGFNGPLVVTVSGAGVMTDDVERLRTALAATPGVATLDEPVLDDPTRPQAVLVNVVPTTAPDEDATTDLVRTLRDDVLPAAVAGTGLSAHVTGTAAMNIDVTAYLTDRMPVFFGAVLTMSLLALLVVFRSVLVPLKAVAMNILSIAAAYGVVVAVFQWGWGSSVLGLEGGPINPFIPLMLFAIVFGLSMDYEVFLLSRIREEYDRTGDPVGSVTGGLASTARVITAAAAIMVVVFGSFVLEDLREIKLFGVGLALAVLIDATLVRMVVVPAAMELLGHRNWWLPAWLDRILPRVGVEVSGGGPPVIPLQVSTARRAVEHGASPGSAVGDR